MRERFEDGEREPAGEILACVFELLAGELRAVVDVKREALNL